jgi:hypothetical protein
METPIVGKMTPQQTAKVLRTVLREKFPGVKFSVRLARGTAYGSANVSWWLGPSREAVAEVVEPFRGESFDGLTDSTVHLPPAALVTFNGQAWSTGLRYVSLHRTLGNDPERAKCIVCGLESDRGLRVCDSCHRNRDD